MHSGALQRGEARARLAISDFNSGDIHVYDARSGCSDPIHVHKARTVLRIVILNFTMSVSKEDRVLLSDKQDRELSQVVNLQGTFHGYVTRCDRRSSLGLTWLKT